MIVFAFGPALLPRGEYMRFTGLSCGVIKAAAVDKAIVNGDSLGCAEQSPPCSLLHIVRLYTIGFGQRYIGSLEHAYSGKHRLGESTMSCSCFPARRGMRFPVVLPAYRYLLLVILI